METRQQPVSVKYQGDVMQTQSMLTGKAKPPASHQSPCFPLEESERDFHTEGIFI